MATAPSLAFLCIQSLKLELLRGDNPTPDVYELPSELLDGLVAHLPALALLNFQTHMPFKCWDNYESGDDCLTRGRKRARNDVIGESWKALFKLRWPELIHRVEPPADWQQLYLEKHLQNCVDEAAEVAMRPTFIGRISSISVSDKILRYICHEEHTNCQNCVCTQLSFHFQTCGPYLRCLRLLNVLCVTETCELLRTSKLQTLVLRWIRSEKHVEPLCKLLIQSRETLTSLEFIHCKLSSSSISAICASLHDKDIHTIGIQRFCIKTSSIDIDPLAAPSAFISFLNSVRSFHSLHFCDSHLDRHIARMVFFTLLDSSSNLSSLDLSDNNISGWLSTFSLRSVVGSLSSGKSLQSLCKLNLRESCTCSSSYARLGVS
uniref:F-box/LRR-repeat protein n=1 Tax=Noccaea caerulescens TaxID=107243 RepID=A0A1J3F557_NOCCA